MKIKKKKIVLISSSLAGGGAEGVCVNIANGLANKGRNVDLLVLNLKDEAYLNRLSKKVNLVILGSNNTKYSILSLLRYIFQNKPKLMTVFNYELSAMLIILRFLFRLKIKIISRNSSTFSIVIKELQNKSLFAKFFTGPLIKYLYQKADHVINQCNGMRNDLIKMYPIMNPIIKVPESPINTLL